MTLEQYLITGDTTWPGIQAILTAVMRAEVPAGFQGQPAVTLTRSGVLTTLEAPFFVSTVLGRQNIGSKHLAQYNMQMKCVPGQGVYGATKVDQLATALAMSADLQVGHPTWRDVSEYYPQGGSEVFELNWATLLQPELLSGLPGQLPPLSGADVRTFVFAPITINFVEP